jgi:hypothetical protein
MSMKAIRQAWKDTQLSGRPLLVLLALATKADAQGQLHTSLKDLRLQTRLNEVQVSGAIETLVTTKRIEVKWLSKIINEGDLDVQLYPHKSWQRTQPTGSK